MGNPVTTVSSKSQIVLPAAVRQALHIRAGDRLEVCVEGDRIVLRRVEASDTDALAAYRGDVWSGHAEALQQDRDDWDR